MRIAKIAWPVLSVAVVSSCFGGGGVDTTAPLGTAGAAGTAGSSNGNDGGPTADASAGGMSSDGGMSIDLPPGLGVGDACSPTEMCRVGLTCTDNACEPSGAGQPGDACVIGPECATGLRCTLGQCAPEGDGQAGDVCQRDADCAAGLSCGLVGLALQCAPEGNVDVGGACTGSLDCYSGLICAQEMCTPNPTGLPISPTGGWTGVECDALPDETEDSQAYFVVPGVASPAGDELDYFRLPFPNDALIAANGTVSLGDFPTPGPAPLGVDAVKNYVDSIDGTEQGWGTSPTVIFRFSNSMDYDTFSPATENDPNPIQWVDVTEGAAEYGQTRGLKWFASGGRTNYVCYNWLAVRRPDGAPLIPGHTYAVFLRSEINGDNGSPAVRSAQLAALLAGSAPGDAVLADAYDRYAPLRDYLTGEGIDTDEILNASVITVAGTRDVMSDLAAAVEAEPVPTSSDWVLCDDGVQSPCPQAEGTRGCQAASPLFDEYHALISLPIFQEGTAPYQEAGGNVVTDAPVREEDVCLSLTVPKGANMPAGGWPLVVFGHGTGGSFRSHATEVAALLANVDLTDGPAALADGGPGGDDPVHFAVLGYDAVEHGPRRGDSMETPDSLFFNFLNPDAARGNPLQGAADVISVGRFAAQPLSLTAQQSGGDAITIDPDRIVFLGHSQGSMHGSLALPYADMYQAAVLSGNGASIIHALLNKTSPVNIAQAVPFLLQDQTIENGALALAGGENHPALTLIGQWIDPGDPVNFARQIAFEPDGNHAPKHMFQTYGQGDTFAPPVTMKIYALAAQAVEVPEHSSVDMEDELGLLKITTSATGNHSGTTIALRQYAPSAGSDGHFVAFDVADARTDVLQFLGMAANGQTPTAGITAD